MPRAPKPKVAVVKKPMAKKKNKLYVMPEAIPLGEILTDLSKNQWKIGPSIGTGGFGEIYSACRLSDATKLKPENYNFVVKCEPHGNGPLFVEMHFYMRNAKIEDIELFKKSHNLKSLGMPHMLASGSHDINSQKHRFIVMPRYGKDILKFFLENGRKIPEGTIYRLAIQMIDVYEYVHNCGYVHADLKGANILLGFGKSGASQAYLVDYGLASHYTTKDFKADPKKMHNGTMEYTSRDAHQGVATMRADFEILGYNMIEWSGVQLSWVRDNLITIPTKVQKAKEEFMSDVKGNIVKLYSKAPPGPIVEFMISVAKLEYNETPDYNKFRKIFLNALKSMKIPNTGDLDFKLKTTPGARMLQIKDTYTTTDSDLFFEKKPEVRKARHSPEKVAPKLKHITPPKQATLKEETPKKSKSSASVAYVHDGSSRSTPISANAKINFSPVVRLCHDSGRKLGKTIINDNITPSSKRAGKTYEFNFELEVSMDANVIVNVKRKKKLAEAAEGTKSLTSINSPDSPVTRVKVRKIDTAEQASSEASTSSKRRPPRPGVKGYGR